MALYKSRWLRCYRPAPFNITVEIVTHTHSDMTEGDDEVEVERIWRIEKVAVKTEGCQGRPVKRRH